MALKPGAKIYFMGIGGTGMAAVAGLAQQAGYKVVGSDKGVYPPMSIMLKDLGIPVMSPYAKVNLTTHKPDLVVVANALSRGNVELEEMLATKIPYVSFPQFLGENFLSKRQSIVIAGTHGKTTTTALCSFVLSELGEKPSYMIGGLPKDLPKSFMIGEGNTFVIEGDEYDTAFFDKGPKFLHYCPKFLILNNIEFDHADIYKNLEAIEAQFEKLCAIVENKKNILANVDDPGVFKLLQRTKLYNQVTCVSTLGNVPEADVVVRESKTSPKDNKLWQARIATETFSTLEVTTPLAGDYNIANIAQCIALIERLLAGNVIADIGDASRITTAIKKFRGVQRRLDHLGTVNEIEIYEDFAHHPTAIRLLIEAFRKRSPNRRLVIAFEPANATGRRNILLHDFAKSLQLADLVFIGKCPEDLRIPENERMDTQQMQQEIGTKALAFKENEDLLKALSKAVKAGDSVIFLSPGSFAGIQYKLIEKLGEKCN